MRVEELMKKLARLQTEMDSLDIESAGFNARTNAIAQEIKSTAAEIRKTKIDEVLSCP